ncbi:MAG: macrolide 2'-phosphotransferase [Alkalibacterium sp.]|nr:macrolide 2'-phosphotransferase [Alkalibacterium sp.]
MSFKKEVLTRASKEGIELIEESMVTEESGLDFQVAFAEDKSGNQWVLRVPRRKDVFSKIIQEKKALDLLNQHPLPFDVPAWSVYSNELIGYIMVKGSPVSQTDMATGETSWLFDRQDIPKTYTHSLAKSLVALHSLSSTPDVAGEFKRVAAKDLRLMMKKRMDTLKSQFTISQALWKRWQKWLESDYLWPEQTAFIHGDLFPGHILIDTDYRVTGMIDWTEARIDDSAHDFTAHYLLFGEEALVELIRAYEQEGGYCWPYMKEHIIELLSTQAMTIAEFGLESGLKDYIDMAQDMLMREE